MKIISDIRLFKSNVKNIDGYMPSYIETRDILPVVKRVVMKLRETNYSLGDFTHLYINFTTCLSENVILPANRTVFREDSWYRFYDVGVSSEFIEQLESYKCYNIALELIKNVLLQYFAKEQGNSEIICSSFETAINQGEQMLMEFNHLGTIQLSSKKVTIKPRQNVFAMNLKPIVYEL